MLFINRYFAPLLLASCVLAYTYPQCQFDKDCKKNEVCCYTLINVKPPRTCLAPIQCWAAKK
ncbi:hypothetical protein BDQ12DRAFT_693502, partial [Crucibulum laeve]